MAWWTLITWLLIGGILVPLFSSVLQSIVFRGERVMVGQEDILSWLLSPTGAAYALAAAALLSIGVVFRYAGIFHILNSDMKGEPQSAYQTLLKILPDLPAQFRLCIIAAVAVIIALSLLLGGLATIYRLWLGEFDLNYYLYARPPEWIYALVSGGIWAIVWTVAVLYLLIRCLPALPAFMDGYRPVGKAVGHVWSKGKRRIKQMALLLLVSLGGWILLRLLVQALLFSAAALLVELLLNTFSSLTPALVVTLTYGLLSFAAGIVISFFGFTYTAILLSGFYFCDSTLCSGANPPALGLHRLSTGAANIFRNWLRPRRAVPLLALMFLLSIGFSGWLLNLVPEERQFTVTAHRAGAFLAPENTLAALERAIETGAEYAEIDVQSTRDGRVVVVHDADLMRVAGVALRVSQVDYADIAGLVQGKDDAIPESERRIATLDQFLERARDRIKLNIELKYYGHDPELARRTVELVRRYAMEDQVVIMSFDLSAVMETRRMAPEIPVGYVFALTMGDPSRLPVHFLAVPLRVATEPFVSRAHLYGKEVHVWTLNTASGMLSAIQRGADSIITDAPDVAVRLREELAALTPHERLLLSFRPRLDVLAD